MSGTNIAPVRTVTANSDISVAATPNSGTDALPDLPGSGRQDSAAEGINLPTETSEQLETSREAVAEALETIAQSAEELGRKLEFSIDEPSGKVVVTVFDSTSEEVIRQIPGERAIAIAQHLASLSDDTPVLGLLLDSQA